MRNGFLKSFLALFIVLNLIFFESIIGWIYSLSDIFWALADFDLFCVVWAVVIVAFIVVFLVYFFKHREKEEIVKVVEFKCPDDMSPLELGFLIDGVVDNEDLSSLLVYWASKKYIEISNEKKNQKITKLVEKLPDESKEYEKKMFQTIFLKDKEVLVDKIPDGLKNGNNVVIKNAIKTVEKDIGDKYFDKKAMWYKQILICATALLYCIAVMYLVLSDYQIGVGYIGSVFAVVSTVLYILVADWFLKYYDYRHKNNSSKGKDRKSVV